MALSESAKSRLTRRNQSARLIGPSIRGCGVSADMPAPPSPSTTTAATSKEQPRARRWERDCAIVVCLIICAGVSNGALGSGCNRIFQRENKQQDDDEQAAGNATLWPRHFEAPLRGMSRHWTGNATDNKTADYFLGPHPNISVLRHEAMHCLYRFNAMGDERVLLSFDSSWMRASEPDCYGEYVDIYLKLRADEPVEEAIGREPPDGRFCTATMPLKVISLYNSVVLSIYSDLWPLPARPMFVGSYEFIKRSQVLRPAGVGPPPLSAQSIGPPEEGTLCTHTIYSSSKREGEFQSVNYPGVYVKDLRCSYKFIGSSGQRVRLEFLDLDLYSGGAHCPFDSVRVFDGLHETDPLIQLICGSHRSLIIFSTREHLLVTFTTLQRGAEVLNRGYSAYFEFSDKFFQPDFIQGPHVKHLRGSECDQRIVSTKGSRGFIVSPDARGTNHAYTICRYFFEGLQSSHDYEKVLLKFTEFDLKSSKSSSGAASQQQQASSLGATIGAPVTSSPLASLISNFLGSGFSGNNLLLLNQTLNLNANSSSTSSNNNNSNSSSSNNNNNNNTNSSPGNTAANTDINSNNSSGAADMQCPDSHVRLYTSEQKPDQRQDPNDYDYQFCSNEVPATIESDAASLLMEYNSGTLGGGYFKAEYSFIVDYRISGYQIPQLGCNYVYRSDMMKTGTFNSPRHPSWYINDMNCTFTFLTKPDEALLMQFTSFKMTNSFNENVIGHNEACRNEDLVEINEVSIDGGGNDLHEIGTYCGLTTPGPILSYNPVQVNFRTNKEQVNYGFSANYHFHSLAELRTNEFVSNCGEQIFASSRLRNGTFASPPTYRSETYEKRNHICSWNITARTGHRIALNFTKFELEGSPAVRGCATATVRLEFDKDKLAMELCGSLPAAANDQTYQYVSQNERFMVTFISTKQASGSGGFKASWMEIKRT